MDSVINDFREYNNESDKFARDPITEQLVRIFDIFFKKIFLSILEKKGEG